MKLDFNIKVTLDLNEEESKFMQSLDKKTINNKCKPFWNNEIDKALRKVFEDQENIKINVNGKVVRDKEK